MLWIESNPRFIQVLDLSKPETFRDLSKPMGTQTQSRLEQYKKRYKDWEELGGLCC